MKTTTYKLFIVSIFISTNYVADAKLVNGFSNIQAANPRQKSARIQASNDRIAEEMGSPVTQEALTDFVDITKNYMQNINGKPSRKQLETLVKAVIDIFRAYRQLDPNDASDSLQNAINTIKSKLLQLNLPTQLENVLQSMAQ